MKTLSSSYNLNTLKHDKTLWMDIKTHSYLLSYYNSWQVVNLKHEEKQNKAKIDFKKTL